MGRLRRIWDEFVGPEGTATDNTIALSLGALGAAISRPWRSAGFPAGRRLLGATLTAGGILFDLALGPSRAAPWFAPVFYVKLLLGHASSALWPARALRS